MDRHAGHQGPDGIDTHGIADVQFDWAAVCLFFPLRFGVNVVESMADEHSRAKGSHGALR